MIKPPVFPASRTVTGLTLDAQPTSMFIISSVAGDTRDRGVLEGLGTVTLFTSHFHMLAQ